MRLGVWAVLLTAVAGCPAIASWQIMLDGSDITAFLTADGLRVIDRQGAEWTGTDLSGALVGPAGTMFLKAPLLIVGAAAYVPIETLSEFAALKLDIDRDLERAELISSSGSDTASPDGWTAFTLAKPRDRREEPYALAGAGRPRDVYLPGADDKLRVGLGVGYVQNADWAQEITATGKYRGLDINLGTRITEGRLVVADKENGWSAEGGNLYSDLRGLANGVRYTWIERRWRQPYVSLYVKSPLTGVANTTLAYGDEIRFGETFALGGELALDASHFLKGRFKSGRLLLYGFRRSTTSTLAGGSGAFGSYQFAKNWSLYATYNNSGTGPEFVDYRSLGIQFPLPHNINVSAEVVRSRSSSSRTNIGAVTVGWPFGPVRLLARMQTGRTSFTPSGLSLRAAPYTSNQLMTSVAYFADPRLSFNFQSTTAWQDTGGRQYWNLLLTNYQISPRTHLQVINDFPQLLDPDQLRLRLTQYLATDYSLILDYGLLQPFQAIQVPRGERGLMVMIRKQWDIASPARGGRVEGRVADAAGNPLRGAVVCLGKYRYVTDANGRYSFEAVPRGGYKVYVDENELPADYRSADPPRDLEVANTTRRTVDFRVIPQNSICGSVILVKDKDGRQIREALTGIVLRLKDAATASLVDGSFGFYNLDPGSYVIEIDKTRLPAEYEPISPTEARVELKPDAPTTGIEFLLKEREKPVMFQEMRD